MNRNQLLEILCLAIESIWSEIWVALAVSIGRKFGFPPWSLPALGSACVSVSLHVISPVYTRTKICVVLSRRISNFTAYSLCHHHPLLLSSPLLSSPLLSNVTCSIALWLTYLIAGRWTREEHHTFIKGLEMYGKGWKKIASLIKTRTVVQIRTHAQKYFLKLTKARQSGDANMSTDGKASGTGGRKVGCTIE